MSLMFLIAPFLRLAVMLVVTFAYWRFKGFCCQDWESASLSKGATAWFFITAAVILMSLRDLTPAFLDIYEIFRPVYDVFAVLLCVHVIYCFLWVALLAMLSMALCFLDTTAKKIGLGLLLDNKLITLRPHGGYINLFTFLAFLLLLFAIFSWYNMITDLNEFNRWAECGIQRSGRSVERRLSAEFEPDECCCQECSCESHDHGERNSRPTGVKRRNSSSHCSRRN